MPLAKKQVKMLTGAGLVIATLALRLPFMAKSLFEFDSVAYAVATFRFSLEQVTPHMPGYILHVLLGRFFLLFTSDHNQAFVLLSVALSVASVLLIWRAGAWLRGERLGVIAACLWITTPLFWFYGEVATVYIHEAFFASLLLYLGIRRLRESKNEKLLYYIVATLSLAAAARQSSFLLFLPAVIYLFRATCWSWRTLITAGVLFLAVTATWVAILLSESGGIDAYMQMLGGESIYRSQSILFGNALGEHLAVIGKVGLYLVVACIPFLLIFLVSFIRFRTDLVQLCKESIRKRSFVLTMLVALPALLFYVAVYFMKAGYLLNILPSVCLIAAVIVDQTAIWFAREKKSKSQYKILFTGKLIVKNSIVLVGCISLLNCIWFFAPLPGKDEAISSDLYSRESIVGSSDVKYAVGKSGFDYLLNKCFAYTSLQGIETADRINTLAIQTIEKEKKNGSVVILDSWWVRFSYYYMPDVLSYNIRSLGGDTLTGIYKQSKYFLTRNVSRNELLPRDRSVLIFIRPDHPDFPELSRQVQLVPLLQKSSLGIYKVADSAFTLTWKNYRFSND
ncbi:MAG TPA: DUF2723 domain-containing protein [Candidatus Kapabacteria bacterium]